MSADIRGITLRQPWAYAVAYLGKSIENRSWRPTNGVDRLLIHAGAGWDDSARVYITAAGQTLPARTAIASSAIVAVATLAGVCSETAGLAGGTCDCGVWAIRGQHHWQLADVQALATPIPCRGRLGLWHPPADLLAQVREQVTDV